VAKPDLFDLESHFQFGANWRSFAQLLDSGRIEAATRSLQELVGPDLSGKSFLDIGCGSGLSSLAAARLGAELILATDIDPLSTKTTAEVLARHLAADRFTARTISVFDMSPADIGSFDVVYSWGVLHHTGAMWKAIERALEFTKPGGLFVLAIYKKTPFCAMWKVEKSLYSRASRRSQRAVLALYRAAVKASRLVRQRSPGRDAGTYQINRGMDEDHDFHDWLGGYPYESATPDEIDRFLAVRGFCLKHAQGLERSIGLLGSGCAEYVYLRSATPAAQP
jgi:2-polyprenyl-6-hydroxyphenyl methylase/3-demethylubiquinone-9 3-methyltransferase